MEKYFTYLERLPLMLCELFQQHTLSLCSKTIIFWFLKLPRLERDLDALPTCEEVLSKWNRSHAQEPGWKTPLLPRRFGKTKQIFSAPDSILLCPWKVFPQYAPFPPHPSVLPGQPNSENMWTIFVYSNSVLTSER